MKILDRLGIKSVKIVLAVILSLLIGNLFKFQSPYLAAITAIIGIQETVYDAVSIAKGRIIGTAIGIVIGIITVTFLPSQLIVTIIGLFLIIYVCDLLNLTTSIVQASVIYLSIMLFPSPNDNAVSIIISITTGVIVSIVANFSFSPFELKSTLNRSYYELIEYINLLCLEIFTTDKTVSLKEFNSNIIDYNTLVDAYHNEYFKIKGRKLDIVNIDQLSKYITKISFFMYGILELREYKINKANIVRINKLLKVNIEAENFEESKKDLLLNFHVDKLLNYLEAIEENL